MRKVMKLFASLAPFLQRFDRYLRSFCTQKREGGHKEKHEHTFHKRGVAGDEEDVQAPCGLQRCHKFFMLQNGF